jgi:hypothetical protein
MNKGGLWLQESMAARNILVVAVPYALQFDLQRTADDIQVLLTALDNCLPQNVCLNTFSLLIQDAFTSCMDAIESDVRGLPVYGVGHSTGALLTLLINSRFSMRCDANILLSYNNRSAHEVIPFLAPLIAPSARAVGPLLSQAASNPIGMSVASLYDAAKTLAPSVVKMGLPAFEQISPVFMDVVWPLFESDFTASGVTRWSMQSLPPGLTNCSCCILSTDLCDSL